MFPLIDALSYRETLGSRRSYWSSYFCQLDKEVHPEAKVDWVVEKRFQGLVEAHPSVDRLIAPDIRGWKKRGWPKSEIKEIYRFLRKESYDAIFDLQGNSKSALFTFFAKGSIKYGFSRSSVAEWPNLFVTNRKIKVDPSMQVGDQLAQFFEKTFGFQPQERRVLLNRKQKIDEEFPPSPRLMVCPGSNWDNKRLKLETLIDFLKLIEADINPFFIFIWGSESEKVEVETLQKTFPNSCSYGQLDFGHWQGLMERVDLVVTMDSASLHLCGLTSTPSFSIFGPSKSSVYRPVGHHHNSFQGRCPYNQTFVKRCPKLRSCSTGACMKEIAPKELFREFQDFWSSLSKSM